VFALSWRANPVTNLRIPLSARWLSGAWEAPAFTSMVVPITVNSFTTGVEHWLASIRNAFTAATDFIPGHVVRALLWHTLARAPLGVPLEEIRAKLRYAQASAGIDVEVISTLALLRGALTFAACLTPELSVRAVLWFTLAAAINFIPVGL